MSKMVKRVATAIYNDDFEGEPSQAFEDRDLDIIGTYITNARAAIGAMRLSDDEIEDHAFPNAAWMFNKFIDSALNETDPVAQGN